jgi:D-serine deaminase-like pyridoxal phosphate-dependent protein
MYGGTVSDLEHQTTPYLRVDLPTFESNLSKMSGVLPGAALRPHVKAFKSTSVAKRLHNAGHVAFCCATIKEIEGMASAGLGDDLLLANEVLDAQRLGAVAKTGAQITVAVDSKETIDAAVDGGVNNILIDVNVGLRRCGCAASEAGSLAKYARSRGLNVRGVMGYEGHLMMATDRKVQAAMVKDSMGILLEAHTDVGGPIVSAGGTGTFDINSWATEIQAGSYLFMDTEYAKLGLPFLECLSVVSKVISVSPDRSWAVVDAGLKALGMDHGNPSVEGGIVGFCSDEHTTLYPLKGQEEVSWKVGDHVFLSPAHVDPTIAKHERMLAFEGNKLIDEWPVDLRGW